MNRPYFIGYDDKHIGKKMLQGPTDTSWYSDFQSAKAYSFPEAKRVLPVVKRMNKDKTLHIIKITMKELVSTRKKRKGKK